MKKVQISDDAVEDLNAGFLFYESQEPGLGDYFVSSLRAEIESLKIYAGTHPIFMKNLHRQVGKTFPYCIFYSVEDDTVNVVAVIDLRRDPDWIEQHLN